MFDKEYRPPNPGLQQKGTPITYTDMNQITGELGNIVTGLGGVLDVTKADQVLTSLTGHFAPLNSPTLTGIPLTSNPDGTVDNQIATVDYVNQKALQATVGFTPTQQGGGTDQGANKIYIGGDSTDATQVRVQVDQTDLGRLVFQDNDAYTHGVDQIGFNIGGQTFAFRDASDKSWRFLYTTSQIDEKSYISSLPDGNNLKVSDIIWNSSSSLPALYYGSDNSVAYLATETWANTTFQPVGDYATNTALANGLSTKQAAGNYARTDTSNTFNGNQKFNDTVTLSDGRVLQTIGGVGGVIVNRYTDSTGLATTDLNNAATGANISWFRLYQDGMLRTNIGDLAFTSQLPTAGTITGGTFTKTPMNDGTGRSVLRQSFVLQVNDYATVNFPIAYPNPPVLNVYASDEPQGKSVISNYRWNTLTGTGFQIHNSWLSGGNEGNQDGMYINVVATGAV